MCVFILLSLQLRSSAVSVVFDSNASLNDVAPVSPIPFPVDAKREREKKKSELLMDVFCVSFFILYSQLRWSFMSVVFDFNASLNDFTPMFPIPSPVEMNKNGKSELYIEFFCVSSCVFHL